MVAVWLVPTVFARAISSLSISRFQADHAETMAWAPGRVAAYRTALQHTAPMAQATLRIPRLGMQMPVREGASSLTMTLGAGHISGTAEPGGGGNVALASHRDGFFRHLKDVQLGDNIEVRSVEGTQIYRVDHLEVVSPDDVRSLQPSKAAVLTLVTCYPFFYLGPAPQRYIVRASLLPVTPTASSRL